MCINTGILHANNIVKLETAQSLHHQHALCCKRWVWARNDVSVLVQFAQHFGDVEHVGSLNAEVQFFNNGFGKQFNKCRRVSKRTDLDATNEVGRKPCHYA